MAKDVGKRIGGGRGEWLNSSMNNHTVVQNNERPLNVAAAKVRYKKVIFCVRREDVAMGGERDYFLLLPGGNTAP